MSGIWNNFDAIQQGILIIMMVGTFIVLIGNNYEKQSKYSTTKLNK